nr:MAG: putative coat protein [Leviviridae sp.]
MIGDSITFTYGGSGGTAVVCNKINQDGYGAEYLNKGAVFDTRIRIRNSQDTVKADSTDIDRHIVTVEKLTHPTEALPFGRLTSVSFTVRNDPADAVADVVDVGEGAAFSLMTSTILGKLFGWES